MCESLPESGQILLRVWIFAGPPRVLRSIAFAFPAGKKKKKVLTNQHLLRRRRHKPRPCSMLCSHQLLTVCEEKNQGDCLEIGRQSGARRLALSSHGSVAEGLIPGFGPFCVGCACSPCVHVGSLRVLRLSPCSSKTCTRGELGTLQIFVFFFFDLSRVNLAFAPWR